MFSTKDLQVYKDGLKKLPAKASEKPPGINRPDQVLLRSPIYKAPGKQQISKPPPSPRKPDQPPVLSSKPPPSPRKEVSQQHQLLSKPPPSPRSSSSKPKPIPHHPPDDIPTSSTTTMNDVTLTRTPLPVVHKDSSISTKDRSIPHPKSIANVTAANSRGDIAVSLRNNAVRPRSPKTSLPPSLSHGSRDGLSNIQTRSHQSPNRSSSTDHDDKHNEDESLIPIKVIVKPSIASESPRSVNSRPNTLGSSSRESSPTMNLNQMNHHYDYQRDATSAPPIKRSYSRSPTNGMKNHSYRRNQTMDPTRSIGKRSPAISTIASLCMECMRMASEGAVCFIGNDGKVSACTTRPGLRLCKNPKCAAHNPDYVAAIANAPKKYLVSKRHNMLKPDQAGPKSGKTHGDKNVGGAARKQGYSASADEFSNNDIGDFKARNMEDNYEDDDDDLLNGVHVDYDPNEGDAGCFHDGDDELSALSMHMACRSGGPEEEEEEEDRGAQDGHDSASRDIEIDFVGNAQATDNGAGPPEPNIAAVNEAITGAGDDITKDDAEYKDDHLVRYTCEASKDVEEVLQPHDIGTKYNHGDTGNLQAHDAVTVGESNDDGGCKIVNCHDGAADVCHARAGDGENSDVNVDFVDMPRKLDDFKEQQSADQNLRERRRPESAAARSAVEALPSPEAVVLRKQQTQVGKLSEEWLPNHAIEEVVSKLAPQGQKKVKILVEAFETILTSHTDVKENTLLTS